MTKDAASNNLAGKDFESTVLRALAKISYANTSLDHVLARAPKLTENDGGTELELVFKVPVDHFSEAIVEWCRGCLSEAGVELSALVVDTFIPKGPALNYGNAVNGVKNIIAVSSGKGGVGKSTTAVNLALALAKEGANVGVLDADIYGPSQPAMLGVEGQRPEVLDGKRILPIRSLGLQLISMGNLVNENTPMVWRGPMVSGALQQLLLNTDWDNVDYLIIDMPPGTGDIPLTLSQKVPVTGSVIVTTPQDIALLDAKKGIEMFNKVNIPVFGVVENMAVHHCSKCGHEEHIFGEGGGQQLAAEYGVPVLGSLPLALNIREQTDQGRPPVFAEPESSASKSYVEIARKLTVAVANAADTVMPEITIS